MALRHWPASTSEVKKNGRLSDRVLNRLRRPTEFAFGLAVVKRRHHFHHLHANEVIDRLGGTAVAQHDSHVRARSGELTRDV
jgi:hypothetical protein